MKRFFTLLTIGALLLSGCSSAGVPNEEAFNDAVVEKTPEEDTPSHPIEKEESPSETPKPAPETKPEENKKPAEQPKEEALPPASDSKPSTQETPKEEPKDETPPAYLNMTCAAIKNWQVVQFENAESSKLKFPIPAEWKVAKENATTYNLERDGTVIGTISTKDLSPADKEFEYLYHNDSETEVTGFSQINQYGDQFYRVFQLANEMDSDPFILNLKIHYSALDQSAVANLLESTVAIPMNMTTSFPNMNATNSSKIILIVGNSFVNTSKIGATLQDMLTTGKTGYKVKAISRGMAEVEDFANDTQLCDQIRSGRFCYVFQCGFYGGEENVIAFETIVDACKASNTKLVIFPAHNESASIINSAKRAYSGPIFLDWKGEITQLIDNGINKWDLCIDDSYKHSTPLAGYVGAHMIYRNLFRQTPPTLTQNAGVSMDEVRNILGDYAKKTADPQITSYSIK